MYPTYLLTYLCNLMYGNGSPPPAVVRCCAGSVQYRSSNHPMTCATVAVDHADCTGPIRQLELDHTDHTDQEYTCPGNLSRSMKNRPEKNGRFHVRAIKMKVHSGRRNNDKTVSRRPVRVVPPILLRGAIVNRTYGKHKNLPGIYLPVYTHNIWSFLLWSPVVLILRGDIVNRTYGIHKNLYI